VLGEFSEILDPSLENVRSLSLPQQLGTHYRMTFGKLLTQVRLSAI